MDANLIVTFYSPRFDEYYAQAAALYGTAQRINDRAPIGEVDVLPNWYTYFDGDHTDIEKLFDEHDGANKVEQYRLRLKERIPYTLIDGKSGDGANAAVATVYLADVVVAFFDPSFPYSVDQAAVMADRIKTRRQRLTTADLPAPLIVPIPVTRNPWSIQPAERLIEEFLDDWVPVGVDTTELMRNLAARPAECITHLLENRFDSVEKLVQP